MENHEPNYQRPNTVSGLTAKQSELLALRDRYKAEVKRLNADLGHIDATIRLFDPAAADDTLKNNVVRARFKRGQVKRFVLDMIRETSEPITSRQIAAAWTASNPDANGKTVQAALRKRINVCLNHSARQGLIVSNSVTTDHDVNGPYKLWQLKRGDQ